MPVWEGTSHVTTYPRSLLVFDQRIDIDRCILGFVEPNGDVHGDPNRKASTLGEVGKLVSI